MPKRGVRKGPIETMRGLCRAYFSIIDCIYGWLRIRRVEIISNTGPPFETAYLDPSMYEIFFSLLPNHFPSCLDEDISKWPPSVWKFLQQNTLFWSFLGHFLGYLINSALFKIRATLHYTGWLIETLVAAWHYSYITEEGKTKQSGFCSLLK